MTLKCSSIEKCIYNNKSHYSAPRLNGQLLSYHFWLLIRVNLMHIGLLVIEKSGPISGMVIKPRTFKRGALYYDG